MGRERVKQFLDFHGKPLLAVTLEVFQSSQAVDAIILVVPPGDVAYCKEEIISPLGLDKVKVVVPGGRSRQESVRRGMEATNGNYGLVVIHDGVRPLVDHDLIERVIKKAKEHRAAVAGIPVKETVKEVGDHMHVAKTWPRGQLWLVQTPQVFFYEDIMRAHQKALADNIDGATDDSFLVERLNIPVKMVKGSERNIKVTTPYDLELARYLWSWS